MTVYITTVLAVNQEIITLMTQKKQLGLYIAFMVTWLLILNLAEVSGKKESTQINNVLVFINKRYLFLEIFINFKSVSKQKQKLNTVLSKIWNISYFTVELKRVTKNVF